MGGGRQRHERRSSRRRTEWTERRRERQLSVVSRERVSPIDRDTWRQVVNRMIGSNEEG